MRPTGPKPLSVLGPVAAVTEYREGPEKRELNYFPPPFDTRIPPALHCNPIAIFLGELGKQG